MPSSGVRFFAARLWSAPFANALEWFHPVSHGPRRIPTSEWSQVFEIPSVQYCLDAWTIINWCEPAHRPSSRKCPKESRSSYTLWSGWDITVNSPRSITSQPHWRARIIMLSIFSLPRTSASIRYKPASTVRRLEETQQNSTRVQCTYIIHIKAQWMKY